MSQTQRIQVSENLRDVLLEFTINYLLDQPGDNVFNYAADYFLHLKKTRKTDIVYSTKIHFAAPCSPEQSVTASEEPAPVAPILRRRKSVYSEPYDPEQDIDDTVKVIFPKSDEQRAQLAKDMKNILLFRALDPEQTEDVLDAMFEKKVDAGDVVIHQGDDGDNFYVIQTGIFDVFVKTDLDKEPAHVYTYDGAGSFGELALLYNVPRAATIKANSAGALWAMDRDNFRRILLKSAFNKRKMYEALLDSVPMLKALKSYERLNLADALQPKLYSKGERIIKQNDAADGMYFVETGNISITVTDDKGKEVEINRVGKGGYFGELALVTHRPRAASAFAQDDVKLAFLDVETFERLLGPCKHIMERNISDYQEQMRKSISFPKPNINVNISLKGSVQGE